MFIAAGSAVKVSSNLKGKIDDFMPPEVLLIYQVTLAGIINWTRGAETNSLKELENGSIYFVQIESDLDVPAFADPEDETRTIQSEYLLKTTSDDDNFANFPQLSLHNNTTTFIKFILTGRDDDTYTHAKEVSAAISCDDAGLAVVHDSLELFNFGLADLDISIAASQLIVRAKNTTVSYVGTTKWGLKMSMTTIKYKLLL